MAGGPHTQKHSLGFTIVEVMIVLAVTGLLFVSVALVISGKQANAEFDTAIRDAQSQIQEVINETASGYYPDNDINCTGGGTPGIPVTVGSGGGVQGTNAGCIFLGKTLHFSSGSDHFTVIPMIGSQLSGSQQVTGALAAATPVLLANSPGATPPVTVDDTAVNNLEYGLSVVGMYYDNNTANTIGSVAFAESLGSLDGGGQLKSGSQSLNLIVPKTGGGSSLANDVGSEAAKLDAIFRSASAYNDSSMDSATNAEICFGSGSTDQSGLITLSNKNSNLAVELKIFSDGDCT